MVFFVALLINGMLAGSIYTLIAFAFVVIYKASRMINFALGEIFMFASRLAAAGLHGLGVGLLGVIGFGCAGMVALAMGFNRLGRPFACWKTIAWTPPRGACTRPKASSRRRRSTRI